MQISRYWVLKFILYQCNICCLNRKYASENRSIVSKKRLLEIVVNLLIVSLHIYLTEIVNLWTRKCITCNKFGQEENVSGGHVHN